MKIHRQDFQVCEILKLLLCVSLSLFKIKLHHHRVAVDDLMMMFSRYENSRESSWKNDNLIYLYHCKYLPSSLSVFTWFIKFRNPHIKYVSSESMGYVKVEACLCIRICYICLQWQEFRNIEWQTCLLSIVVSQPIVESNWKIHLFVLTQ
jgi:hypothetical protein